MLPQENTTGRQYPVELCICTSILVRHSRPKNCTFACINASTQPASDFSPCHTGGLMYSLCGCRLQLLRKQQPILLPDLIARFHANPLRDRSVLLLLLSKEAFDLERLVRRLEERAAVSPPRQPPAPGSSAGPGPPPPRELSRASAGERSRRARARPRPPAPRAVRRPAGRKASARRRWGSRTRGPPPPPPRLPGIPTQPATARELGVSRRGDGCRPMVSP